MRDEQPAYERLRAMSGRGARTRVRRLRPGLVIRYGGVKYLITDGPVLITGTARLGVYSEDNIHDNLFLSCEVTHLRVLGEIHP